ncbi:PREDICTED: wnt inhibitory factor 1 [Rhinopithecus bieti]|uniref:wnt inhibitory factor 1 n=1 Tax=Rhinopithecus bieti TaxID=61621 RepID=UPI00083C6A3F|nr:PREDICTED: wnt inhibitory factor 1 [Rhinopithecus bieti]
MGNLRLQRVTSQGSLSALLRVRQPYTPTSRALHWAHRAVNADSGVPRGPAPGGPHSAPKWRPPGPCRPHSSLAPRLRQPFPLFCSRSICPADCRPRQLCQSYAEYFYEFLSLRSLDKGIMADPTVNVPLLGTVPHKASVVQVGFPCLGKQDGVAAFEVNVIVMNSEGNTILQTPQNAIFFKTCQQAECPGGCRNGGFCNERRICECPDGFHGPHCEKALCTPRCMNGGLCVTPGFCICPPGFYGVNCDKANCSTTCFNGGTCFYPGKCICPPGLEGEQCEISKCPQPCRNGGKCIGKSKCKCSKGYQGDLCSKPVCEPGCGAHGTCHEPNKCQCQEGWHGRHCNKRYGASLIHALRPAGAQLRQHTPSLKKAEERQDPPESNYIW